MNGVLQGGETAPKENWGDTANAGLDLRGATILTFWAKGAVGGERVEFFAFGMGRDAGTGLAVKPYPDSLPKISTGYVTLTDQWVQYTISLAGKDLSYIIGGFGWITNAPENLNRDITFYLDDIQYDKARPNDPRFLVSYETQASNNGFDLVMRNVAFTYDNAIALLALLSVGETDRAKLLADALVYAQQHDRFYADGRIRNAYQGGDLVLPPGWESNGQANTIRMPGWYDPVQNKWLEDEFNVSTHTGNMAWAMLALLAYYERAGGDQYLTAAQTMGDWVETNCRDTRGMGGYTGGFEGRETNSIKLMYKSTEHNIDLYAAFQRQYLITGETKWQTRAKYAKQFIQAMWDPAEGKFWTGTDTDGVTINKTSIPVDIQAWAILALKEEGQPYLPALDYVEAHQKIGAGFDFNQDQNGIWYEGTAQMAAAYYYTGRTEKWQTLVTFLKSVQNPSESLPAADRDGLTTGFNLPDGTPLLYYYRPHVGATAWFILAQTGKNPFWMK
jgi:hypothetical protein